MSDLNVFKFGYYSWRCPLRNIRQFFRNIKYAWQRATKGYCDVDVWSLCDSEQERLIQMIEELRKTTHGTPIDMTEEEWDTTLRTIVYKLKEGKYDSHSNIFADDFEKRLNTVRIEIERPDHSKYWRYEDTPETEEIRKAYIAEEERLHRIEDQNLKEAFQLLTKYWNNLWD